MSLVHNERTKLTANWLNAIAAGAIIVGAFAALVHGLIGPDVDAATGLLIFGVWFVAGGGLHVIARSLLGSLRE